MYKRVDKAFQNFSLDSLRSELVLAEAQQQDKLQMMKDSEKLVLDRRRELDTLRHQVINVDKC